MRTAPISSRGAGMFRLYSAKLGEARARTRLPYSGLLGYYAMCYLLRFRWLRGARAVGELLQRSFGTNHSVNGVLATVYSQQGNPTAECRALMRVVQASDHDHDIELLARAGESAAYAGDATSLERVRDIATRESPSVRSYLDGLLAFLNGQTNYRMYFAESVESFFRLDEVGSDSSGQPASTLTRRYLESGRALPEYFRQAYNIRELASIDELLVAEGPSPAAPSFLDGLDGTADSKASHPDVIVLISCSDCYLRVFGDYFIETFRRKNANIVHFHVLTEDVEATRNYLAALGRTHSNIRSSFEPVSGKSQTYITLARFLICRDIIKLYRSDVLISDIDMTIDFDLSLLGRELRSKQFDLGLCDPGYRVPWAKFSVGFSYFRVANDATDVYLDLLSRHLTSLYSDGGFFAMDMTGVLLIHEYMQARGYNIEVQNLYSVTEYDRLVSVPRHLERQKIKCKWVDGGPQ